MSTGNIVVSQDAPAKNNLWIQPKGTARFWNGSIWKTISGGGGDITLVDLMGSSAIGTQYSPLYWTGSVFSPITYTLSSTVNAGTANALAYYSGTNAIDDALHLRYYEGNSAATTPASYYRLHLYGSTYGNTAANMISGTAGLFSFGDGGPQITFDTNATPGGSQAGALIFTDHDTAATGVSWHFVSNQSDWNVTSKRFHARTGISIGTNLPNTSYNLYTNGTSYFNGNVGIGDTSQSVQNLILKSSQAQLRLISYSNGENYIESGNASWSDSANLHISGYNDGNINKLTLKANTTYISGNVGIGTDSPAYKLDVAGDIKNTGAIWLGRDVTADSTKGIFWHTGNSYGIYRTSGSWASNNYQQLKLDWPTGIIIDGGSQCGKSGVQVTGNFWATGGVTALQSSSSDKRLKKEIKPFNAKQIIDKLKPVEFEWNKKANKYNSNLELNKKNYGLIAQDSDGIIDNLVFDLPDNSGYKGVRYEKLIPILLQAIKELKEEVEKLKNKKT